MSGSNGRRPREVGGGEREVSPEGRLFGVVLGIAGRMGEVWLVRAAVVGLALVAAGLIKKGDRK